MPNNLHVAQVFKKMFLYLSPMSSAFFDNPWIRTAVTIFKFHKYLNATGNKLNSLCRLLYVVVTAKKR